MSRTQDGLLLFMSPTTGEAFAVVFCPWCGHKWLPSESLSAREAIVHEREATLKLLGAFTSPAVEAISKASNPVIVTINHIRSLLAAGAHHKPETYETIDRANALHLDHLAKGKTPS